MIYYDAVLYGASMAACAAACRLRENGWKVLIVEKGILTAPEFTAAFCSKDTPYSSQKPETAQFRKELEDHNILSEENICFPALHPAVCAKLKKMGVDCLFRARICSIKKAEDKYNLSVISLGSHIEISASFVCNAVQTSLLESGFEKAQTILSKELVYSTVVPENAKITYHAIEVPAELPQEQIVSWFHCYWKNHRGDGMEKVCALAKQFSNIVVEQTSGLPKCRVIPSGKNWEQAYDLGVEFAERMVNQYGTMQTC